MTETADLGLRERKRAQTRSQLERAAVTIALRDGVEGATIDAISAEANVSPRTFFNYFDSKEDAILGLRDPKLSDETIDGLAARHEGEPPVEALIGMLFDVYASVAPDFGLHKDRKEILHRNPQLFSRQMTQMGRMMELLVRSVSTVLGTDDADVAEVAFGLGSSAFRVVIKEWMATDSGELDREPLQKRAVALARKTIGTLE